MSRELGERTGKHKSMASHEDDGNESVHSEAQVILPRAIDRNVANPRWLTGVGEECGIVMQ